MIAFLFLVSVISVGNAVPISDAASGAQDRDFFAEKLVDCVKTKRESYSEATKTFSGDAITNEAVNECLKQSLEELRPYMKTGIDSLDLEPTDPLMIDNFEVYREISAVTIQTKLKNVAVRGLSTFVTRKVAVDLKEKTLRMVITVPNLFIKGDYATDSNFVAIRVKGNGPFTANLTKVTGDGRAKIKVACTTINGKPGQQTLMVEDASFDFNIAKSTMKLENLFPEAKTLAKVADDFLNSEQFVEMVEREVKPELLKEVNQLFEEVMNSALGQFPVNDYLKETGHDIEC